MKRMAAKTLRCAIYTRVSTDHRLEQEFNSLDNQREAAQAYVKSQAHEGWRLIRDRYDGRHRIRALPYQMESIDRKGIGQS